MVKSNKKIEVYAEYLDPMAKVPISVNTDLMTIDEIHAKLKEGYNDIEKGNVQDASDAFQRFRKTHE
ncbi:MAG: hypothetical protein PHG56_05455 [Tissierellia bacterium]|nr:hypothetical protein [Tissierellia bacterium]MDD3751224.1 hypothetical protein [Tissierellia bacterium]MDD4045606.1 hypothetical protein [Tissierellia bacterium]MDD4678500.1 hypothetical protein [Tissierellia bacterium]